jgi:rSAM/selenodomain-associated transferase 1
VSHVLVVAKAPEPGRSKTRLCPPCTPDQAAGLALAALADTLAAVAACGADERILALDGRPGEWLPAGFRVIPQRGRSLQKRLANAWADAGGPGLQIGMDTPQLRAGDLDHGLAELMTPGTDAVLGPAVDGGWWAIGLHHPHPDLFRGVPFSVPSTGARQRARLVELGLRVRDLAPQRDVDTFADARLVAGAAPHTRFARLVDAIAG